MSIPGVSKIVAEVLLAETGSDMSVFPTAAHLTSWAGTAPGGNESAGRKKSTKPGAETGSQKRPPHRGAGRVPSKGTYLSAKYRRIAARPGPLKALVAVEHSILVAAWNMLTNGDLYRDPGASKVASSIWLSESGQLLGPHSIHEPKTVLSAAGKRAETRGERSLCAVLTALSAAIDFRTKLCSFIGGTSISHPSSFAALTRSRPAPIPFDAP